MSKKLILTMDFPPKLGGIATYVAGYAKEAPKESCVVLTDVKEDKNKKQFSCTVFRTRFFFDFFWPKWLRAFFEVLKKTKSGVFDSLHVHNTIPLGYVAFLIKKFRKIPYVLFFHGTDIACIHRRKHLIFLNRILTRNAHLIVVNSQATKARLLQICAPEAHARISILYPCPDSMFFEPVSGAQKQEHKKELGFHDQKIIITVARMVPGKGHVLFLSVFSELVKKNENIRWVVIGDGSEKELFLEKTRELGLEKHVMCLGPMAHDALFNLYAIADVALLLNHQIKKTGVEEGFGLFFAESQAMGIPVVAGKTNSAPEIVTHGETGFIVDAFNQKLILETLEILLSDSVLRKKMGEEGRKKMENGFAWKKQKTFNRLFV